MPAIDGLGSGLDTTSIINQLMQIERLPQARLSSRRLVALSQSTTWAQVGSGLTALQTAARALSTPAGLRRAATSSSSPAVGVSALPTAAAGSHSLDVTQLAAAHSLGFGSLPSATAPVGAGALFVGRGLAALGVSGFGTTATGGAATGTYALEVTAVDPATGRASITVNGTAYADLDTSSGSVEVAGLRLDTTSGLALGSAQVTVARTTDPAATATDLLAQLNGTGAVATGSLIEVSPGSTTLLLSGTGTGTANGLTVATEGLTALGGFSTVRPASDAKLVLDGLAVTRASNTVTDLLPGVTLTLQAPVTGATIGVSSDGPTTTAAVKGLVTSLNAVLGTLTTATAYNAETKKTGPLTGDGGARTLVNALRDTVSSAAAGASSTMSSMGLALQRDGSYALDEAAFGTALAKDPAGATDLVNRISAALVKQTTDANSTNGTVRTSKDGADATARDLQGQVDAYETRLGLTQNRLQKQFNGLERALGLMRSQGNALSGQLSSLNRSS